MHCAILISSPRPSVRLQSWSEGIGVICPHITLDLPGDIGGRQPRFGNRKRLGSSQCLASLSAIDSNNRRFALVMPSKDLISRLTGLPRFTCSGTLGAEGFPSP